jgi:hypothetical protein
MDPTECCCFCAVAPFAISDRVNAQLSSLQLQANPLPAASAKASRSTEIEMTAY